MRTLESAPGPTKEPDPPVSIVSDYIEPKPGRHLPQMLLATTLVAVLPLVSSLALRAAGLISGWASVGLAVAMSLAASTAGNAYWRKRGGHGEVLFGELLLWGWVRSWRQEHELANATRLLDLVNAGSVRPGTHDELSVERREQLLVQLAGALEGQDVYLNGHSRRVARHAMMIARGLGLPSEDVARIRAAAAVHDVGKLLTPKAILNKPGRLTDGEFEVIKRHPVDGAEMVAALGDPELTRIVRHHHERLDGAGYPDHLRGEEIPVGARIIAVADTFDAITSARPYRDAAPHQKAIDILRKEAGTQLDPDAVKAFLTYYSGSRPTVIWAIITSSVRRVVAWLSGDPASAATISAGKVAAVTVATASIGAAAAAAPVPVLHHPPLPALGHAVIARPNGVAVGLRRRSGSVPVILTTGVAPRARATSASNVVRPAAHGAPAKHPAHRSGTAKRIRDAVARGNAGSHRSAGSSTGSGTSAAASHSSAAVTPGGGNANGAGAVGTGSPASPPTPASKSQGSNANGNAYGHTKLLGDGHGKGVANGHGDANPSSSPSSSASQPAPASGTVTDPTGVGNQGSTGNQGGNGGSSHGNDNGNGNQAQQANASAVVVTPSPSPAPTAGQDNGGQDNGAQENGDSQGNGNGHGYGHDTAANGG